MGAYSPDVTYTCDDYVAPFVLHVIYKVDGDPTSGIKSTDYYIMFGENYAWTGKNEKTTPWEEAAKQNNVADKRWALFAGFSTIAAEIAFIRFGLMAGAVMCQDGDARSGYTYAKMFSQTGQDGTTDYEKFDPAKDAWDSSQKWKPNLCLDFLQGKMYGFSGKFCGQLSGVTGTFEYLVSQSDENGNPLPNTATMRLGNDGLNLGFNKSTLDGSNRHWIMTYDGDFSSQGVPKKYLSPNNNLYATRSWRYYSSDILCRGLLGINRFFCVYVSAQTGGKTDAYYMTGGILDNGMHDFKKVLCPLIDGVSMIQLYSPVSYPNYDFFSDAEPIDPLCAGVAYNMVIINYVGISSYEFVLPDSDPGTFAIVVNRSAVNVKFRVGANTWVNVKTGNCLVFAKVKHASIGDSYDTGIRYKGDGWACINGLA